MNNHCAIGIIPARWGSTRFPGKSLIKLAGKPLILWVIEGASRAKKLKEVIVATDDLRIKDVVESNGYQVRMTKSDHPSGTDRVAEVAALFDADVIVNIQGDEPLIDPDLLDMLVDVMNSNSKWDMATAADVVYDEKIASKPSVVKVVCDSEGKALYFSRALIPFKRDADNQSVERLRHIGVYAYRKDFLMRLVTEPPCFLENIEKLEQLRALYIGGKIFVVRTKYAGIGVDTPGDVKIVEEILKKDKNI